MKKLILLLFFSLLFHSINAFSNPEFTVNATDIKAPVNKLVYGINTARWDSKMAPEKDVFDLDAVTKLKNAGISIMEFPGGLDAEEYIWNNPENRQLDMDTDEFLNLCKMVDAVPRIIVNSQDKPELAAEWVRYCNLQTDAFGRQRYFVPYWDIGDESWGSWSPSKCSPEEYAGRAETYAKAMKAVDPRIKIGLNIAPWGLDKDGWSGKVLTLVGKHADYLSTSFYPQDSQKEDDNFLLNETPPKFAKLVEKVNKAVEELIPEKAGQLRLVVNFNSVSWAPGPQSISIVNAVWLAKMFGVMLESGIEAGGYWAIHNAYQPRKGDYGIMTYDGLNTPHPPYYTFVMFSKHFGDNLLHVSSPDPSENVSLYASTRESDNILCLMLINSNLDKEKEIDIKLEDFKSDKTAKAWRLSENFSAERINDIKISSDIITITLPELSVTAIEIPKDTSVTKLPVPKLKSFKRLKIIPEKQSNLASNTEAKASSVEYLGHMAKENYNPVSAIDGNMDTRWCSAISSEPQWISLDFKKQTEFSRITLAWEEAAAKEYSIQISNNAENWTDIYTGNDGKGGIEQITFSLVSSRYLRILCTQRTTIWGYSLYEIIIE